MVVVGRTEAVKCLPPSASTPYGADAGSSKNEPSGPRSVVTETGTALAPISQPPSMERWISSPTVEVIRRFTPWASQ
jgi:hypothetical protein